jgi:hypothetical protein
VLAPQTEAATFVIDWGLTTPVGILSIHNGDTVTWNLSLDMSVHTVTSSSFDSGDLAPGDSYSHVFLSLGVVSFHCSYHNFMTGTIIVLPSPTPCAIDTDCGRGINAMCASGECNCNSGYYGNGVRVQSENRQRETRDDYKEAARGQHCGASPLSRLQHWRQVSALFFVTL